MLFSVCGALYIDTDRKVGLEMVAIGNVIMIVGAILWKVVG